MPDALNASLLLRLRARTRRTVRREPDPAEMGTAFGLEYVLDQAAESDDAARQLDASKAAGWLWRWKAERTR